MWTISAAGVLIGIVRTSWSLWRTLPTEHTRHHNLLAVMLVGLVVLLLLLAVNPQALVGLSANILPA
jgi:hypothetical protein